jgi:hypothetical protein
VEDVDDEAHDDSAIPEQSEGKKGVPRAVNLPKNEGDDADSADDEERNAVSCM